MEGVRVHADGVCDKSSFRVHNRRGEVLQLLHRHRYLSVFLLCSNSQCIDGLIPFLVHPANLGAKQIQIQTANAAAFVPLRRVGPEAPLLRKKMKKMKTNLVKEYGSKDAADALKYGRYSDGNPPNDIWRSASTW